MKHTRIALVAAAILVVAAVVVGLVLRPPGSPAASGSPLSFFPPAPRGVVHVPDVGRVGAALAALEKTRLAELAVLATGQEDPEEPIRAVVRQLGFDPRNPESMAEAGIDPARGLAFGQDDTGARLLAVAVADEGRFGRYAAGLAKRLGATRQAGEPLPGTGLSATVHRAAGEPGRIVLAYLFRDGHAVVAADAIALDALGRAAARSGPESLAESPAFTKARERLGPADVIALAADARTLSGARRLRGPGPGPAILGLRLAREGLGLRLLLPRPAAELATLGSAAADPGAPLLPHLGGETFLAARLGGEPSSVRAVVEAILPKYMSRNLDRAGLDLDRDLLANLRAGPVVGVGLRPAPDLSGGLPTAASRVSNYNPFRLVTLSGFARVKDPAAARAVLSRLAENGPRLKMQVTAREEAGETVYTATYAAGTGMTWGLVGDVLVAAGSAEEFAAARSRLAAGGPGWQPADPAAREALARPGASVHLDLPKLAAAVKAIPESSFGVGGFRIKESLDGWAELLSEVRGATAVLAAEPEALVLDVEVGLR